jgi:hypothetical protein
VKEQNMNETEEVRRLFAVATEDMPAGIDLLKGVRARNRTQRTRTRVALSAGAAGIVAAATAITVSAVQAPSALAQVTQAAARTAGQSYRVSSVSTPVIAGHGVQGPVTISGVFDPGRRLGEERTGDGLEVRFVGGSMYIPLVPAMRDAYSKVHGTTIPAGKTWLRVPGPDTGEGVPALEITQVGGTTTGLEQLNPQDLLALLQRSSQVSKQGPASGPGWSGTAYTFTASLTTAGPLHLRLSSTGTVDVDQQGRVRQLDATETVGRTVHKTRVRFGDFGLTVSVSPPPASETFTPPAENLGPRPTLSPSPAGSG